MMLTCTKCSRMYCNIFREQQNRFSMLIVQMQSCSDLSRQARSLSTTHTHYGGRIIPKLTQTNINMQKKLQIKYSEDFIQYKVDEYDLGKRRLARMMGDDPETYSRGDVRRAIQYLFPSDLFHHGSRAWMKHPTNVFPVSLKVEADKNGRPFHHLFYTKYPEIYAAMTDVYLKILEAQRLHDNAAPDEQPPEPLKLNASTWKTVKELQTLLETVNVIPDDLYQKFIAQLERLVEEPYAAKFEEFIMKHRNVIKLQSAKLKIPRLLTDEDDKKYCEESGKRKTAIATVKLFPEGTGKITVNGKLLGDFFSMIPDREIVIAPFTFLGQLRQYDVEAVVDGGFSGNWSMLHGSINSYPGMHKSAMAGAIRLAISKALLKFVDREQAEQMRRAGLLTYDVRRRERKKPGQEGARRKFTWKKR